MNKIHLYHDTKYNHNHNHNHNHNYNYDFAKVNTKLYSLSTDFFHLIKNIKLNKIKILKLKHLKI